MLLRVCIMYTPATGQIVGIQVTVCCHVALQAMGIQRYVFCSIFGCDKHPEVPLMSIKAATEKFLASSGVPYTTLRLCE